MTHVRRKIDAKTFKEATGCVPQQDDLVRCNCEKAGQILHQMCGWDEERNLPNFWPKKRRMADEVSAESYAFPNGEFQGEAK